MASSQLLTIGRGESSEDELEDDVYLSPSTMMSSPSKQENVATILQPSLHSIYRFLLSLLLANLNRSCHLPHPYLQRVLAMPRMMGYISSQRYQFLKKWNTGREKRAMKLCFGNVANCLDMTVMHRNGRKEVAVTSQYFSTQTLEDTGS